MMNNCFESRTLTCLDKTNKYEIAAPFEENHSTTNDFTVEEGRPVTRVCPEDPLQLLILRRHVVERIRIILGNEDVFNQHVLPSLFNFAALVQSLPRVARGLYSFPGGMLTACLDFVQFALNALETKVIASSLAALDRARWSVRVQVAVVYAALLSDVNYLSRVRLDVGFVDNGGLFIPQHTWHPEIEPAFNFFVRHVGCEARLWRLLSHEIVLSESILSTELLRLIMPQQTRQWLSEFELLDGESVLTSLKTAVAFRAGSTDTSRLISEVVSTGRCAAITNHEKEIAHREGRHQALRGFAELFDATLRLLLLQGRWTCNERDSVVFWSEDALWLRWPQALNRLNNAIREDNLTAVLVDEAILAASLLSESNVIEKNALGKYLFEFDSTPAGDLKLVKLLDSKSYVNLLHESVLHTGVDLPEPWPPLLIKSEKSKLNFGLKSRKSFVVDDETIIAACVQFLGRDLSVNEKDNLDVLLTCIHRLIDKSDCVDYAVSEGLFIPVYAIENPEEIELNLKHLPIFLNREVRAKVGELLRYDRSIFWKCEVRQEENLSFENGFCLKRLFVRAVEAYASGEKADRGWYADSNSRRRLIGRVKK